MQITDQHLSALAHLLKERVGFDVRPEGHSLLRLALADRLRGDSDHGSIEGYLSALTEREEELERLLPLVTVGKTSFFRDPGQFRALATLLPPLLFEARQEGRRLSIWSAGCASGEEPYSIAMALLEAGATSSEVELLATDLNPEAVAAATRGRYRRDQLDSLTDERILRFFQEQDGGYLVRDEVRKMVDAFRPHNLHAPHLPLPEAGRWDVIFCRNVLIYFEKEGIRSTVHRFHEAMRPGAWLFLGYSESLFKLFGGFQLVEQDGAFLYRRPAPYLAKEDETAQEAGSKRAMPPQPRQPAKATRPAQQPRPPAPRLPAPPPPLSLEVAIERIEKGAFEEAVSLLQRVVAEEPKNLAPLLTLANVLALLRRSPEAETRFRGALALDPLSPEALLYYGMFFLGTSCYERAEKELLRAVYLAPDFALAHYILGRCQEKVRNLDGARRSYRNALRAIGERQRPLSAFYPDLPREPGAVARAAELALAAL